MWPVTVDRPDIILIHPPAALPCQPAPGPALLAGRLRACGARVQVVDANIEALCFLLQSVTEDEALDTTQRRALGQRERSLELLRSGAAYSNRDRHHNAVSTLRRLLRLSASEESGHLPDLAQYTHAGRSPMRSEDLLAAAREAEMSPYAPYFAQLTRLVAAAPPGTRRSSWAARCWAAGRGGSLKTG